MAPSPASLQAVSFDAPGLGDRSYLVHDGWVGVVVDPQRELERYLLAAESLGVRITHVLETHVHNDYVTGGLALAREVGAAYVLPEGEDLAFADECTTVGDGALMRTGSVRIRALWTPGHTANHLAYLLESESGGPGLACTGGSVLHASVGRTDLLGLDRADELATAQWHSARRLLTDLDPAVQLLPTHGFGSFCSASPKVRAPQGGHQGGHATVAEESARNPAMRAAVAEFVRGLAQERPPVPAYYRYMAPINRSGPSRPHYGPVTRLAPAEVAQLLADGAPVTDLRPRRVFAAGHRRGALNIELGDNLTTYFGWVVPFEAPYTLVVADDDDVQMATHLLARIGREHATGYVLADDLEDEGNHRYPVATFADLAQTVGHGPEPFVLDIRHGAEWRSSHLAMAHHVPLPELPAWRPTLPDDREIWVHCAAGFRAAIAASQLSAWGLGPVLVDDAFEHAADVDLEVVSGAAGVNRAVS
jgi:glyoxylase-like metal-dependent hydrolase (beta-lactamase superfamily II)/rhodanese-related sulfurtransferase